MEHLKKSIAPDMITVLIAEDSPTQAEHLAYLLEENNFTVLRAANGCEAYDLAQRHVPDIIISDIVMPEMDGYALCRSIKSNEKLRETPIVLVTELASPHDVFKGLDAGADNFIVKPYQQDHLLSRIDYLLANRKIRKSEKLQVGIEIELAGQRHFITAERQQILDLLISTYDQAIRLYDELDVRQKELSHSYETLNALYGFAEGLNRCRTTTDIANTVLERGLQLPGVRAGWIYLRRGDEFELVASIGEPTGLFAEGDGAGPCPCQASILDGALDRATNIAECQRLATASNAGDLRYHASVPLIVEGEPVGILNLVGSDRGMFSDEELRTLTGVGNQVAIAVERTQLNADLEAKVQLRTEGLRQANETLEAILDASPIAIITVDRDAHVLTWNRSAEAIFGYTTEEVLGRPSPLHTAEVAEEAEANYLRVMSGVTIKDVATKRYHKDGSAIDVRTSGSTLYDASGEIRGAVFTFEDVTARNRAEQQLRQSQKMEALGGLTGGIAHDFNNLLTIIVGNLDLLDLELADNAKALERVESARHASLRGADLTRQLLAFARSQPLEPEVVDLNKLIQGMVKLLERTLGENIRIAFREVPSAWSVRVDPAQLDSAIVNLAINARDAMQEGGQLSIEIGNVVVDESFVATHPSMKVGDYVGIDISDSGTGISPEHLDRIFEPFFTTKEPGKGTGLGLAMVYGFASQSGGHVTVYSELGRGTTFRIYLPRSNQTSESGQSADDQLAQLSGSECILVVEDNEIIRSMVEQQLTAIGYTILTAQSADEALAVLQERNDVQLLFSDVMMPGRLNGIALAAEVNRSWPAIRVLLTSGFTATALQQDGSADGFPVLSKPYRALDLARRIRQVLQP